MEPVRKAGASMSDKPTIVNGWDQFNQHVLDASTPVMVCFYANWDPYSQAFIPKFEQLSEQFSGPVHFASIDVDANPDLEGYWGVRKIPTTFLFENGRILHRWVNETRPAVYRKALEKLLAQHA